MVPLIICEFYSTEKYLWLLLYYFTNPAHIFEAVNAVDLALMVGSEKLLEENILGERELVRRRGD